MMRHRLTNTSFLRRTLPIAAAALLVAPTFSDAATISGDLADAVVQGNRNTEPQETGTGVATQGGFTLKVGAVGTNATAGGRGAVYVFQLPNLGAFANPFDTASLTFSVGTIDANTTLNGDLYGLGRRAAPEPLATDYYLGDLDASDATLIQNNILSPTTPANSTVLSSAGGNTALAAYLNTQYASGAGVGEYVFLRLSPDDPSGPVATGYNVYTANSVSSTDPEVTDNVPFITYSVVPEPASWILLGLGVLGVMRRRRML